MTIAAELALANHILYDQGIVDAFGHVSVRDPADPRRFLLSRNMAPPLVDAADILPFALDGRPDLAAPPPVYLERFIHAAIYAARPDVQAVVHSHAPSILPFGAVPGAALCPICHMGGFIPPQTPIFEIRDAGGPATDMLIRTEALGAALARTLGSHALVLMRGHGMTVVGGDLRQAVFRSVYVETNARIQLAAQSLGPPAFLNPDEASAADAANVGQIGRAWDFWALKATLAVQPLRAAAGRA